ncbi:flagellar basal body-associated FliL family protein [Marinomonas algicola]|uniref:flagellar basal body-associated FliL family protein n=1 Tax=Marinomonas algicola TaxID=2773454 RepID=UPI0017490C57|nr:flagellar basal body-associated FliL family protein [Marinomonas algicola]
MKQRTIPYILLTFILSFFALNAAYAEEEGEAVSLPVYIELSPDFIVNYGSKGSKLKYIKTRITLRTKTELASYIDDNMPLVRDAIVIFMSQLKDEHVKGALAREQSRKDALVALNETLKEETGQEPVIDLLFASFVTQ